MKYTTIEHVLKHLKTDLQLQVDRSPCLKKKVGAILFNYRTGEIVGRGYGGAQMPCIVCVRKQLEWQQDGCWSIHSEMRAIFDHFNTYGYNTDLSYCIIFVSHGPCDQCLKLMSYFNIRDIYYIKDYHNDYSKWDGIINVHKLEV